MLLDLVGLSEAVHALVVVLKVRSAGAPSAAPHMIRIRVQYLGFGV